MPQALDVTVAWYRAVAEGQGMRAVTLAQIDAFCTGREAAGRPLGVGAATREARA
jgi:hypothetical protein